MDLQDCIHVVSGKNKFLLTNFPRSYFVFNDLRIFKVKQSHNKSDSSR
jgi:hypothetical protein